MLSPHFKQCPDLWPKALLKTHFMKNILCLVPMICLSVIAFSQKIETVYLDPKDSSAGMYIAVIPQNGKIDSFLFLLDGFGNSPASVLVETSLPVYAASKNMLTIIPLLKTGPLYFGSDAGSQESLKQMIELTARKYHLTGKSLYLGGFSIGGTCVVKYAELANQNNYPFKPKAVFAVDPPLDWERFYHTAKRVVRLAGATEVNSEVTYMIGRIAAEMGGTPENALPAFYSNSPYSYSDTTQAALKTLIKMPLMLVSEPDIQWWLSQRGYDYSYINITDQAAMINELQKLGNRNAVLVTTINKGFRKPGNRRHPHSWSIANPQKTIAWLQSQQ
jgi:hypothetical protein